MSPCLSRQRSTQHRAQSTDRHASRTTRRVHIAGMQSVPGYIRNRLLGLGRVVSRKCIKVDGCPGGTDQNLFSQQLITTMSEVKEMNTEHIDRNGSETGVSCQLVTF
jgi:hypothetical protein